MTPPSRVVGFLQARLGSTRLPRKVLAPIAGTPMLQMLIERLRTSRKIEEVVVITTTNSEDGEIEELCYKLRTACFRGSELDVLDRMYQAAVMFRADIAVRLTADNPLVDGAFLDESVERFKSHEPALDYATTSGGGYPLGLSVEVFTFAALTTAWKEDQNPVWREHVTPFIYKHPERFSTAVLHTPEDLSSWRWTVDTPADLAFVRALCDRMGSLTFGWRQAASTQRGTPDLVRINSAERQLNV